jgi:hypothetical protein
VTRRHERAQFSFLKPIDGNETRQNNRVAELLRTSLVFGPEHLNLIHSDWTPFTSEAEVIGIQEGLEGNQSVQLDWVVADGSRFVGYETKVAANLGEDQLVAETEELDRLNPTGENILCVITEHYTEPSTVRRARNTIAVDTEIRWTSWHDLASTIDDISKEEIQKEQIIINDLLYQTFDEEGYLMQFNGLHADPAGREEIMEHQQQLVKLAHDVELMLRNQPLKRYRQSGGADIFYEQSQQQNKLMKRDYQNLVPQWFMFPFHPEETDGFPGQGKRSATSPGILSQLWSRFVYVGIRMAPYYRDKHFDSLTTNAEIFENLARDHDFKLFTGWKKWEIVNEYEADEIRDVLEDTQSIGEETHKRVLFGRKVNASSEPADEVVTRISDLLVDMNHISWVEHRSLFYPTVKSE